MLALAHLKKGIYTSVVAAVAILALLVQLEIFGIGYAFSIPAKLQMLAIWLLAIPATFFYWKSGLSARGLFRVASTLAVVITLVGLVLLFAGSFVGIELIVLGYIFEPIAGTSIFLSLSRTLWNYMFIIGAWTYTLGLPLYLYDFGYVSIVGDFVKLVGLVKLLSEINANR